VAVSRATGLSPQAYLHRRIRRDACELLANTGLPVSQIAFHLGYVDPAYFNHFLTRQSGQCPGKYRHLPRDRRNWARKPTLSAREVIELLLNQSPGLHV